MQPTWYLAVDFQLYIIGIIWIAITKYVEKKSEKCQQCMVILGFILPPVITGVVHYYNGYPWIYSPE